MEVYFNELCLDNNTDMEYQDVTRLKKLYSCLRDNGIGSCRISRDEYAEMIRKAKEMPGSNRNVVDFLYAFLRQPYETESVEERQMEYLNHSWTYQGTDCYGFALAYIMDSMAISICDQVWNQPLISVEKDDASIEVRNLYDEITFSFHLEWLEGLRPVQLVKCHLRPEEKIIKLRDDHGKDKLLVFSRKIVNSEYVCEIMNSLPFNPGDRRFIHNTFNDGRIEVVLPWTDEGLGILIKTTGRNKRETDRIAEILKKEYGSKSNNKGKPHV